MEKLSFFSLRKSIFQLLHPINHWLCWSRAVSRGRAVIAISAETMSTSTLLWPLLYILSRLELGYITRNYTNSSPAQAAAAARPEAAAIILSLPPLSAAPAWPWLPAWPGPAWVVLCSPHYGPGPCRRTIQLNYNNVGAQIDFPIFYGDRSWCNTFSSHYLHLLRVTEERPEIIMALAISLIVYLGLDVSVC